MLTVEGGEGRCGGMARLARVEYAGALYHVTVRGNNRRELFQDNRDRIRMIEGLGAKAEETGVRVYAFCLMSNHVHLFLETPHGNLGRFMHKWQTGYTVYYNQKHGESGHLMQGRYGAKPVEGDRYVLNLTRYIHLNPVFFASMRNRDLAARLGVLRGYRWSSYGGYRTGKGWDFVEEAPMLELMGGRGEGSRRAAFAAFTEAGVAETDEEFVAQYRRSRFGIGRDDFLLEMEDLYRTARRRRKSEDVSLRREGHWLSAEEIVRKTCEAFGVEVGEERVRRWGSWVRPVVSRMLSRHGGLTYREIATRLGVGTGKSVGDQLERLTAALESDPALAKRVSRLDRDLENTKHDTKLITQG